MASRASELSQTFGNRDAAATPPATTSKKNRLWLGFSAERLRSKENLRSRKDKEKEREQIDSTANTGSRKQQIQDSATGRSKDSAANQGKLYSRSGPSKRSAIQDGREDYDESQSYDELDELADPAPIDEKATRPQGHLEDRSSRGHDSIGNLDEVADPVPVDVDRRPGNSDLEQRNDDPGHQRASRLATELYTLSYLILFSLLGTLARLGLQALTFYPGAPVQTTVLWANVGGSLILGFLSEDQKLFEEEWGNTQRPAQQNGDRHDSEKGQTPAKKDSASAKKKHGVVKKTLPLYIGLAVGFCGSFTSFSSFMRDAFYAMANALHVPINHTSNTAISTTINVHRNGGYSFMALCAVLIVHIGLSLGALQVGAHLALGLDSYTPSIPYLFGRRIVDRTVVFLAWGCWLGAIMLAIFPPDRPGGPHGRASWRQETWRSQALFALVFAPPGCVLRFYVSLKLNSRIKSFPLGTFAVNILGTALEATFIDIQRSPVGGMVGCQVLQGMADGFCGCLTTVSTWVSELSSLRLRHAYLYGAMSAGVGLAFMTVIAGSLLWTHGFVDPLCLS